MQAPSRVHTYRREPHYVIRYSVTARYILRVFFKEGEEGIILIHA